nr:glycosyltransferase [Pseudoalteromonas sp. OANN1]
MEYTHKNVRLRECNYFGSRALPPELVSISRKCCVSFTIFGPVYRKLYSKVNVVGFAQPWIIYPKNEVYKKLGFFDALKSKLKYRIQKKFFKKADLLVVEHDLVKRKLVEQGFCKDEIEVVSNAVSAPFLNSNLREVLPEIEIKERIKLGYIGRNYIHKNLEFILEINDILISKYKEKVGFVFTLSNEEMDELSFDVKDNFYSYGAINSMQCPSFYEKIDGLIFPSLLECFSASPLEAIISGKPVFACKLPFVSEVYHELNTLFEPGDAEVAADLIYSYFHQSKEGAVNHNALENVNTAKDRAQQYLRIIASKTSQNEVD